MALEQIVELRRQNARLRDQNLLHAFERVREEAEADRAMVEFLARYDPTIDTGRNPHDWSTE